MREHPLNKSIAMPDCLSQLRALKYEGELTLTDELKTFSGLIYKSDALLEISTMFNYEAMGHGCLIAGCNMNERAPVAEYIDGRVGPVRQGNFYPDRDFEEVDLDPDLKRYEPVWRTLFEKFSYEVASCFGNKFELRLKCLEYDEENFHQDPDFIIAIQPMGKGRKSTICVDEKGGDIRPESGELIVTTPALKHSWPVSKMPRLGLAATLYPHHLP